MLSNHNLRSSLSHQNNVFAKFIFMVQISINISWIFQSMLANVFKNSNANSDAKHWPWKSNLFSFSYAIPPKSWLRVLKNSSQFIFSCEPEHNHWTVLNFDMLKKRDYVIGSIVIYGFLFMLQMLLDKSIPTPCEWNDLPCVRFCCNDMNLCQEELIRKEFNASVLDELYKESSNGSSEYTVLIGTPVCTLNKVIAGTPWTFTYVSYFV